MKISHPVRIRHPVSWFYSTSPAAAVQAYVKPMPKLTHIIYHHMVIRHTMTYYHVNKKNTKKSIIYCLPWLRMCPSRVGVGLCLRVVDGESHCTHICKHAQHHTYDVPLHANGVCEWVWRSFFVIRDIWIETHLKCSKSRHVNLARYFVSLFQPAAIHIRGPCW